MGGQRAGIWLFSLKLTECSLRFTNHVLFFLLLQLQKIKSEISEINDNPQGLLLEALHSAGYSGALAKPLMATESVINRLDISTLEEFIHVRFSNLFPIHYLVRNESF
jgi:hypothetical protein